jgi:hypothetical protein
MRRAKIDGFAANGPPDAYLKMALQLTIDWALCSWDAEQEVFSSKIFVDDGSHPLGLFGDGMWNTLYVLVGAFRFTHDMFYLDLLWKAWARLSWLARNPAPVALRSPWPAFAAEHGLIPAVASEGETVAAAPRYPRQQLFVDVLVASYRATVEAGWPREEFREAAVMHARRIQVAHLAASTPRDKELLQSLGSLHQTCGEPFLFLALADRRPLRRITLDIQERDVELTISPGLDDENLTVPDGRAIVYMNDGDYVVTVTPPDRPPCKPVPVPIDEVTSRGTISVPCHEPS